MSRATTSIQDSRNDEVLPAVRELLSHHPAAQSCGAEALARMLHVLRFLPYRPAPCEVGAALEALLVEGELAA